MHFPSVDCNILYVVFGASPVAPLFSRNSKFSTFRQHIGEENVGTARQPLESPSLGVAHVTAIHLPSATAGTRLQEMLGNAISSSAGSILYECWRPASRLGVTLAVRQAERLVIKQQCLPFLPYLHTQRVCARTHAHTHTPNLTQSLDPAQSPGSLGDAQFSPERKSGCASLGFRDL